MEVYSAYMLIEKSDGEDLMFKSSDIYKLLAKLGEFGLVDYVTNWHISALPIEGFTYQEADYEALP